TDDGRGYSGIRNPRSAVGNPIRNPQSEIRNTSEVVMARSRTCGGRGIGPLGLGAVDASDGSTAGAATVRGPGRACQAASVVRAAGARRAAAGGHLPAGRAHAI